MTDKQVAFHDLPAKAFPFHIVAIGHDDEVLWEETIEGPGVLEVPGFHGAVKTVRAVFANGEIAESTTDSGERMSKLALPCIVCEKPLQNVDADIDNQPWGGTEFTSYGHYGSTIHDSIPGTEESPLQLVVNICDTCIMRALDADVIQSRSKQIALSHHPVRPEARAWVLAQNEKAYGSAWGKDEPVDYRAEMIKAGWPESELDKEEE